MNAWNAVGFLAAGLVITAFCMKDILHLRIVAVASNVAFLAYGVAFGLIPVWLLHLVLLPVNLVRLWQVGGRITTSATQDNGKTRPVARRAPRRRRIRTQANRSGCELPERADTVSEHRHPIARSTGPLARGDAQGRLKDPFS
jgi:hypothetical protein